MRRGQANEFKWAVPPFSEWTGSSRESSLSAARTRPRIRFRHIRSARVPVAVDFGSTCRRGSSADRYLVGEFMCRRGAGDVV